MKFIVPLFISLLYILALTLLFEYTINEVSNTILTITGVCVLVILSYFYFRYIFKTLKRFL